MNMNSAELLRNYFDVIRVRQERDAQGAWRPSNPRASQGVCGAGKPAT